MRRIIDWLDSEVGRWLVFIVWIVFLTILLLQPLQKPLIPTGVKPAPPSFTRELYFSLVHVAFFCVTGALLGWALHKHLSIETALRMAVVLVILYGLGTEAAQSRVPGRAVQLTDLLADSAGAVAGAWIYYRWAAAFFQRVTLRIGHV